MKLTGSLSLAASLLLAAGCSRTSESQGPTAGSESAVRVRVYVVRAENAPALTEITGTVRPSEHALVASKLMGTVEGLPAALGQPVHKGDVLLRIGAAEIGERVVQARSQENQAARDLARERELLPKGASTAEMVGNLEDRHQAAQAALREAEAMLAYATVRAPFDGVVSRRFVNQGDLASPGMPLVEVEGSSGFVVEAGVPDSLIGGLSVGSVLSLSVPTEGNAFSGRVSELSSSADPGSHTVAVKISVPDKVAVRSGQFARVLLPSAPVRVVQAPLAAVSSVGQMERVFVVGEGGRALLRLVRTGAVRSEKVEILSGLDEGDRVVVSPPAGLAEGQALEILP